MRNIQLISSTLLVSQLEISGKEVNELHPQNIALRLVTLFVTIL